MRITSRIIVTVALACPGIAAAQSTQPPQPAMPQQATPSPAMPAPGMQSTGMQPSNAAQPAAPATQPQPAAPAPQTADQRVQKEFEALDRDGDGSVSPDEHAAAAKARFDARDTDRNYEVSASERNAEPASDSTAARIAGTQSGAKPMDANNNGAQSPEESRLEAEAGFRARDTNGDGSLSPEEMKAGAGVQATPPPATQP